MTPALYVVCVAVPVVVAAYLLGFWQGGLFAIKCWREQAKKNPLGGADD